MRGDPLRPVHNEWRGDAPFVRPDFVAAERGVTRVDQPGPRHKKEAAEPGEAARSWPSPRTITVASVPLSEKNMMIVLSQAPIART